MAVLTILVFVAGILWKFGISADDYEQAFNEILTISTMVEGSLCVGLGSVAGGLLSALGQLNFLGRPFHFLTLTLTLTLIG